MLSNVAQFRQLGIKISIQFVLLQIWERLELDSDSLLCHFHGERKSCIGGKGIFMLNSQWPRVQERSWNIPEAHKNIHSFPTATQLLMKVSARQYLYFPNIFKSSVDLSLSGLKIMLTFSCRKTNFVLFLCQLQHTVVFPRTSALISLKLYFHSEGKHFKYVKHFQAFTFSVIG